MNSRCCGIWIVTAWLVPLALVLPVAAQDNATLKGKVVFKGDTKKFGRNKLDTAKDPNCKVNQGKRGIGSYEVIINRTDPPTLQNVVVSIRAGLGDREFPVPNQDVRLDQVGCEYVPHVVALMEGQALRVTNSDPTNHNVNIQPRVNPPENFSQPRPEPVGKVLKFKTEEVPIKVKCDVHPWMGAWIAVFKHPYFVVTGRDGTFELSGLPPGKFTVAAWHEKFGSQTMEVEVESGATLEKNFIFEPKEEE